MMTTRSIVTSQPDVACDVCQRRLLRGEQPDDFIADGQRRLVCELCAPRAAHEGWLRETDAAADVTLPPMRPRRGRSLLDRVHRRPRAAPEPTARSAASAANVRTEAGARPPPRSPTISSPAPAPPQRRGTRAKRARRMAGARRRRRSPATPSATSARPWKPSTPASTRAGSRASRARSGSPSSACARRSTWRASCGSWSRGSCAGTATRSTPAKRPVAQAVGQGTELDQLAREEREGNALADRAGMLGLSQ